MTRSIPSKEVLEKHAQIMPEINPSAVIAMLEVLQAADEIQHAVIDVLEKNYQLSKGKLHVMIILHQSQEEGITPSRLAEKVGVDVYKRQPCIISKYYVAAYGEY